MDRVVGWAVGDRLRRELAISALREAIARYIDAFYNPTRRHSVPDYLSVAQFERLAA